MRVAVGNGCNGIYRAELRAAVMKLGWGGVGWAQGPGSTGSSLDYRLVRAIAGGRLRQLAGNLRRCDHGMARPQEPIQKMSSVRVGSPGESEWEA